MPNIDYFLTELQKKNIQTTNTVVFGWYTHDFNRRFQNVANASQIYDKRTQQRYERMKKKMRNRNLITLEILTNNYLKFTITKCLHEI